MKHHIERTTPKGGPFIGSCLLCGKSGLGLIAAGEDCPNSSGMDEASALAAVLAGPSPPTSPPEEGPGCQGPNCAHDMECAYGPAPEADTMRGEGRRQITPGEALRITKETVDNANKARRDFAEAESRENSCAECAALRAENKRLRAVNESVAVCMNHTDEVIGEGCLVCETKEATTRLAAACRLHAIPEEGVVPDLGSVVVYTAT